jgi:hypothetical protein
MKQKTPLCQPKSTSVRDIKAHTSEKFKGKEPNPRARIFTNRIQTPLMNQIMASSKEI